MTDKKKPLILVVSVVIINKNKQILMQERPKNKNFGGYWELPGGKIELYETPEIALLREIQEELNIKLDKNSLTNFSFITHEYEDFFILMPIYISRKWKGTIKANDEQTIMFCDEESLNNLKIIDADIPLIKPMIELIKK